MKRTQAALLTLLRSGLWEKEIDELSCFPLSADEWEDTYLLSKKQSVTGIVFRGLQFLPDALLPPEALLLRWTATTDQIERRNREMNLAVSELYDLFRACGLEPVLQKGQGVALYYESPLLRECGDIDLYFKGSHAFKAAESCLREKKIQVEKRPDNSLLYLWKGIEVEQHRHLLDLHNPFLKGYADRIEMQKGYSSTRISEETDVTVSVASPLLCLLMLDLHILKHALGRGIGLRQFCDMARACYKLKNELSDEEMRSVCRKFGLGNWNPLLRAFLKDILGLPEQYLPYAETTRDARPLLEIVWQGGNFGLHRQGYTAEDAPAWKRKALTARTFCTNLSFAARYAPKEAFWIFTGLLKGQIA